MPNLDRRALLKAGGVAILCGVLLTLLNAGAQAALTNPSASVVELTRTFALLSAGQLCLSAAVYAGVGVLYTVFAREEQIGAALLGGALAPMGAVAISLLGTMISFATISTQRIAPGPLLSPGVLISTAAGLGINLIIAATMGMLGAGVAAAIRGE